MKRIRAVVCALCMLLISSSGASVAAGAADEPVRLTAPGDSLSVTGTIAIPRAAGTHPAVVLLHGSSGWNMRFAGLARVFADSGYVALALDYYADAGGSPIRSEEKRRKWPRYQTAVRDAVAYLHTLPSVSDQPVALVGFSRGAFLAVSVAGSMPSVGAVVDFFGGGGGGTQTLEQDARGFPPLLILHGEADTIVPVTYAYDLRDAVIAAGGTAELHIYPGEKHGLSEAVMPDAIRRTIAFLRYYSKKS